MDNILSSDADVHTSDYSMESNGFNTHHIFVSRFEREENNSSLPLSAATNNGVHLRPIHIPTTAANIALAIKSTSYDEYDGESSTSSSSADNISGIYGGEESSCYITADEGGEEEETVFMTGGNISLSSSPPSSVSRNSIAESSSVRDGLSNNYDWDDLISFEEGWKGIVANAMTRSISTSTSTSLASSSTATLSYDSDDDDDDDDDVDEKTEEEDKNVACISFASDKAIVPSNIRTMLGGTATYNTGTTSNSCTTDDDDMTEDTSNLFLLLRQGFEPEIEITFFGQYSSDPTIMAIIADKENCGQMKGEEDKANLMMEAVEGNAKSDKDSNRNDAIKFNIPTSVLPTESEVTLVVDDDDDDDDDVTKWTEETIDDDDNDDYFYIEDEVEGDSLLPNGSPEEEEEVLVIFQDDNGGADDTYYYGIDYDIIDSNQASSYEENCLSSWTEEEILDDASHNEESTTVSSGSETNEELVVTVVATAAATTSNNCDTIINKMENIDSQVVKAKYGDLSNRSVLQGDDKGEEQSIDHNENIGEGNVDSIKKSNNSTATVTSSSTFGNLHSGGNKTSPNESCERSYITTNDYHKDNEEKLFGVKSLVSFWDTFSNKRKLRRLVERSTSEEYSNIEGNEKEGRCEGGLLNENTCEGKNREYTTGFSGEDRKYWDQQEHHHASSEIQKDDDADITNVVILGRKGKNDDGEGVLATLYSVEEGSHGKEGNVGEARGEEELLNEEHYCCNEKQTEVALCLHSGNVVDDNNDTDDSSAANINEDEDTDTWCIEADIWCIEVCLHSGNVVDDNNDTDDSSAANINGDEDTDTWCIEADIWCIEVCIV